MNKNMDKEFDRVLREKLDGYRPEVPEGLWGQIQQELDHPTETLVLGKATTPRNPWYRWAAAALFLVAFGALLFKLNEPREVIYLTVQQPAEPSGMQSRGTAGDPLQHTAENPVETNRQGGKKLSDDIRTISRVLATTLQATERKIRETDEKTLPVESPEPVNLTENQFALLTDPAQQVESPVTETRILKSDLPDPGSASHLAALEEQPTQLQIPAAQNALAAERKRSPFGVSRLLNLMVAQIDRRDEKFVSFSNDEEGSLKIDLNLAQAKNL